MTQFEIKRIFSSVDGLMPELEVNRIGGSKSSLQDMFGDKLVFKLNDPKAKYRQVGDGAADSQPDLHFEAQVDMLNGKPYLDVENGDMPFLKNSLDSDGDGKISTSELAGVTISPVSGSPLIENHTRDADVTKYLPSEDVFFEYTPEPIIMGKPGPGTLVFNTDIVSIGIDDSGNVISFICPQKNLEIDNTFVSGSLKSEVEVGEVGGKIDPLTGEGVIYGDELAWKFWGDLEIFGQTISISKDDAAFIPIDDASGSGGLLALKSIKKSAHGGGDIEKVFSSYFVEGKQGNPVGIQKGLLQETVIQAVNLYLPGFANSGTDLQWNIDLQSPVNVVGDEYVNMAHALHMHAH